jgi:protein-L-isoaspartate O-methyltransferase
MSIDYGATISAPHMHAIALQEIYKRISRLKKDIKCLDIGSGSGYL